jgi:hypothetical protein
MPGERRFLLDGTMARRGGGFTYLVNLVPVFAQLAVRDRLLRLEAFEVKLSELGRPPSIRVSTGGGEHVYWLLDEPAPLRTPEQRAALSATLRGLADYLGGDFRATDAARILRIPGTINYPDGKKRAKGRVVAGAMLFRFEPDVRYSLEDFEPFEQRGLSLQADSVRAEYASAAWNGELPGRVARLVKVRPKLAARWEGGAQGLHDASESGVDLAIANLALRRWLR